MLTLKNESLFERAISTRSTDRPIDQRVTLQLPPLFFLKFESMRSILVILQIPRLFFSKIGQKRGGVTGVLPSDPMVYTFPISRYNSY